MYELYHEPCKRCGSKDNYIIKNEDRETLFCNKCFHSEDIYVSDELKQYWEAKAAEKAHQEEIERNAKPKCPICGSYNLKKITASKRVFKTAFFGLAGAVDDAGKTYQCNSCKAKF